MDLENTDGSPMISMKDSSAEIKEKDWDCTNGLKADSIEVHGKETE